MVLMIDITGGYDKYHAAGVGEKDDGDHIGLVPKIIAVLADFL